MSKLYIDNVDLSNPLQRAERLGTGWMGVIVELEGVLVDYDARRVSDQAWQHLAEEEGRPPLPLWALRKAEGMKNEQVIQEVFEWAWNRAEVARLSRRREELYATCLQQAQPYVLPETLEALRMLHEQGVPVAQVCAGPPSRAALLMGHALAADGALGPVTSAADVLRGLPDPAAYLAAAASIGRPPARCAVLCAGNLSIEAAREAGAKAVAVSERRPLYELRAADKVVRSLAELGFMDYKRLFSPDDTAALVPELNPLELEARHRDQEGPWP